MSKFSNIELQQALIGLRTKTDANSVAAWDMTFDELARRMGDDAFDAFCIAQGW